MEQKQQQEPRAVEWVVDADGWTWMELTFPDSRIVRTRRKRLPKREHALIAQELGGAR